VRGAKVSYVIGAKDVHQGCEKDNRLEGLQIGPILRGNTTIAQLRLAHGGVLMYEVDERSTTAASAAEVTVSWATEAVTLIIS
jgi:hypothetical protein